MKKSIITLSIALVAVMAHAGGLLHNTNQHIDFVRMMARGASTDIDAIYTNPAGIAFMDHDGWALSLNIQSAYQTRNVLATFPLFPTENNTKKYKGDAAAPVLPSAYAVYKKGNWAVSGFVGVIGGGGKCSFGNGLPMFDAAVMAGIYSTTAGLIAANPAAGTVLGGPVTPNQYDISTSMRGRQYIYGGMFGFSYKFNNHFGGYAGGRMNYFSGNYRGFVNAKAGEALAAKLAMLGQGETMARIALDCDQTGWGLTPILGLDYKVGGLTLAAKYEFKTNLNIENDTKELVTEPAEFRGALASFEDGVNTPNDLPSMLAVAAGYEFIPGKLRATVEYHYYDDKHAEMAGDKQKSLTHGTHEFLGGVEWDINKTFTVSCGAQRTDYGLSDDYQTHTSFSCDSYSIGLGGAVHFNKHVTMNVGYFWTTYSDYTKDVPAGNPGYSNTTLAGKDVYSRTNKVFGMGIDYKF